MVYIQSNEERTLPSNFDASCALYGAIENCLDYRLTTFEEVASGKFDLLIKNNLFVGSTEFMTEVFKRIGLTNVRLPANSDREHELITLGEARSRAYNGEKLFIKPTEIKLFTGFVLDKMQYTSLSGLPDDTPVMAYVPFHTPISSEWRVYVYRHTAIEMRNYSGSLWEMPSYEYITSIIDKNRTIFPNTYVIDVGILNDGEEVVIEYNDMWAIGNYGIANDMYLRLLKNRYFQITLNR
jgi:ATP-grasp domain, R2K clade family 2